MKWYRAKFSLHQCTACPSSADIYYYAAHHEHRKYHVLSAKEVYTKYYQCHWDHIVHVLWLQPIHIAQRDSRHAGIQYQLEEVVDVDGSSVCFCYVAGAIIHIQGDESTTGES